MIHTPRRAEPNEIGPTTDMWHDIWQETQAPFVPDDLIRLRTKDDFHARLIQMADRLRVIGPEGAPFGLCVIDEDQLDQLYVARPARGTGAAKALLQDGENRLLATGTTHAHLDCLIENTAARRFYTRHGWQETGIESVAPKTSTGIFRIDCMVLEKRLEAHIT